MKPYAERFYKSKQWRETREAYARSVGYICERCASKGIIKEGEIVHHKVHLTPSNIDEPSITLCFDNLEMLCRECHAEEHYKIKRRYEIDEDGRVIAR